MKKKVIIFLVICLFCAAMIASITTLVMSSHKSKEKVVLEVNMEPSIAEVAEPEEDSVPIKEPVSSDEPEPSIDDGPWEMSTMEKPAPAEMAIVEPPPGPVEPEIESPTLKAIYPEPEEKTITVNDVSYTGTVYSDGVIYAIFDGVDTLTFVGDGAIFNRYEWCSMDNALRRKVKNIVIDEGITYIYDAEFAGHFLGTLPNLTTVTINANSLKSIGERAFHDNESLDTVIFNCDVDNINIGRDAFDEGVEIQGIESEEIL